MNTQGDQRVAAYFTKTGNTFAPKAMRMNFLSTDQKKKLRKSRNRLILQRYHGVVKKNNSQNEVKNELTCAQNTICSLKAKNQNRLEATGCNY